jgi:uncharacterized membrane protein
MHGLLSEKFLHDAVFMLVRLVEAAAALVIFAGAAIGFLRFVHVAFTRRAEQFTPVRLDVGRFLALGLEFQLASDLLRTAVAPSFEEIGKLAAVAAIRTALNFFLRKEIEHERREIAKTRDDAGGGRAAPRSANGGRPSDLAGGREVPA